MNITGLCIKRPITTGMFFLALLVLGLISSGKMPIDLFPQVSYPAISISTSYSGAGPEEIEQMITIPIEQAVSTINQVKSINSSSQEGSSRVTVNFNWGLSLDEAANDIRSSIDRIKSRLPDGAGTPTTFKFDQSSSPVVTLGLSGNMDEASLRQLADSDLNYQLQKIEGVARVDVRGGRNREIRVFLKQERLQTLGITAEQVATVLKNENSMLPAGHLAVGVGDFLLRTKGEFQNLDEIKNLVISVRNDIPVYLRDVAEVIEGFQNITSIVRIDGQPGIVLSIQKRSGFNTVAVADRVYQALDQLQEQYPQIKLRILNDDSIYIRRAVRSVSDAAVIGGILAGLILLFFFHNIRVTIIAALAMPVSILATLILAYFSKMTLNTISLGGLALGVGMLVDNAVVVLDNIFRHHQRDHLDIASAALTGTTEMGPAISASTITHICVFFPLLYITGRSGIMFKELSFMVIFSILCSLVVATTLIPMLCAKFLKSRDMEEEEVEGLKGRLVKIQHYWEGSYENFLAWCLQRKLLVIVVCSSVFFLTLLIYPLIGTELVQNTDEGVISVNLQLPAGTRLEETDLNTQIIEKSIRKLVPELIHLETSVGSRGGFGGSTNQSSLTLRLAPRMERQRTTQQVLALLQENLRIPGSRIRVNAPNSMRMFYGGSQFPIAIEIRGYDQLQTRQTAVKVMDTLSTVPGITSTNMSREEERPELALQVNRKRAADFGVTASQIATAVQTNIEGKIATIFRKDGQETQVRVNLQESDRQSWRDLQRIMVTGGNGRVIPLMSIVSIVQSSSPVNIERKDQERNITVSAGLNNRDLASAIKDVRQAISKISLPSGVNICYGGDYQEQQQSSNEFMAAILLSLALVYMVMAAQFESFFDPFVIMLSIPFALGGVLLALLLTDTNFNTQVYLGLIMLGGIVVNNAIVLISYIRILIDRGAGLTEAVLTGARSRLRPILITTVTSILGLLPLALGIGEGSETQTPLARTVIGGLLFSTVLTLVLIPVIFTSMEGWLAKNWRRRKALSGAMLLLVALGLTFYHGLPVLAEPVQKLTITDAITLAMQNSEDGKIIRQKKESAAAVYRENLGGKKLKLYSEAEAEFSSGTQSTELSVTAEKSVPLGNLFGLKSLSDQLAEYNRNISLRNADLQEEQFIALVTTVFQREILAKRELQLAEENDQRSRQFYKEVIARSKLGFTSVSEEMGAQSQVLNAEVNLNRAKQLYRLAQLKLRQLLNLDPAAELELIPVSENQPDFTLDGLRESARSNRTDVKLARDNLARGETLLKLTRFSKQLGITLGWSLERDKMEAGIRFSNLNSRTGDAEEWKLEGNASVFPIQSGGSTPPDSSGTLSLTLKWTFLDGGVRRERIKEAELLAAQLGEEQKKLDKNAGYEVEEVYYNYLNQKDRNRSAELQVNYNRVYLEAAQSKLKVGMATVKDVLDAQIVFHQSELDFERAKSDLFLAKVNLLKATGQLSVERIKEI